MVNYFLFTAKKGDCSHFSSAFVILCRSLGIPARCVGGYAPAMRNYLTGNFEVHAIQAHAWAEIYLPEVGWIQFDPVPDGYMPGPRPDQGLLASMLRTDQIKSLYQSFDSFVRTKGRESIANVSNKADTDDTADGTGAATSSAPGTGKGAGKGKGFGKPGASGAPGIAGGTTGSHPKDGQSLGSANEASSSQTGAAGQNRLNLTIGGQAGRQSALNGSPLDVTFRELFHPPDLLWLVQNWPKVATTFLLVAAVGFALYRFRHLFLPRAKKAQLDKSSLKPSTLAYLKVIADLSEIKFVKEPADTPQEIVEKVAGLIHGNGTQQGLSELPVVLANFMDKYVFTRFVEEEPPKLSAELEEIGNKIHVLVSSRAK